MTPHAASSLPGTGAETGGGAGVDLRPIDLHVVRDTVAGRVVPPPADAVDPQQRAALAEREPLSLLRVLGPEGQEGAAAGRIAGVRIRELLTAGHYVHRGEVVAVHELRSARHCQVGVIAGVPLADVRAGIVLPHEQTREYREERLAAFLDAAGVDVSPVVLTHRPEAALDEIIAAVMEAVPDVAFEGWGQIRHRVWIIDDASTADRVRRACRPIEQLTIVDGHHRVAAALRTDRQVERGPATADAVLLAELVADRDLRMVGFDRRVHVADHAEAMHILDRLTEVGEVTELGAHPPPRPEGAREVLAAVSGRWVRVTFTDPSPDPPDSLPVSLLQERVLGPMLGIDDPRTDRRLEHLPGLGDLRALDRSLRQAATVAFVPRVVTVAELQEVARRGHVLPPKSTYVDPKPGPGVVVRLRQRSADIHP